jgi:hypothetical protein
MGNGALVVLKGSVRVQFEEKSTSLGVDQEGGIARLQPHVISANTVKPSPMVMETTTIQITTLTNSLFCMRLELD